MRGERKYMIVLLIAFTLYVIIQIINPSPINWTISLAHEDKNPFGAYILDQVLTDIFPDGSVDRSYITMFEQEDTLRSNQLILCTGYYPDEEDLNVMLEHVYGGGNVLISAHDFSPLLEDTLNFTVNDYIFDADFVKNLENRDSSYLRFTNPVLIDGKTFAYQRNNAYRRFMEIDTASMYVVAENDLGQPVTIRVPHGKGNLFLNTTPLAFTNLYLLHDENREFASSTLSMLPDRPLHWAEYYMQGRRESATPLRYILRQPELAWGYYILLAVLIIYMIIESKRKQRAIPVIKPLRNTSVDFVNTISSLYYKRKNHRSIADKRISYFLDQLRSKYYLPQHLEGKPLYEKIASKSGHTIGEVESLMLAIMDIKMKREITEQELKNINRYIEEFKI